MGTLIDIAQEINNEGLRLLITSILKDFLQKIKELPASLSLKHHLGETSETHIIRVIWFVKRICEEFNLNQEDKDVLIASALLHDIGNCVVTTKNRICEEYQKYYKTGWYRSVEGAKFHPIIGMFVVGQRAIELRQHTNPLVIKTALIISTHMSHWHLECPKPSTDVEKFLALADYLASRKEIVIEGL